MKILNILCIALLTASVAIAGIYDPDYRGDENSVHAVFHIIAPLVVPPIPPQSQAPIIFETGPSIYELAPIAPSLLRVDQHVTEITLPNFIDELPMKKMRIQMEFWQPVYGLDIIVDVLGFDPEPVFGTIVGSSNLSSVDNYHYVDIEIYPNPDHEEITIFVPIDRLSVVEIDTVSIPEPASLGLLGVAAGGLLLARCKKR